MQNSSYATLLRKRKQRSQFFGNRTDHRYDTPGKHFSQQVSVILEIAVLKISCCCSFMRNSVRKNKNKRGLLQTAGWFGWWSHPYTPEDERRRQRHHERKTNFKISIYDIQRESSNWPWSSLSPSRPSPPNPPPPPRSISLWFVYVYQYLISKEMITNSGHGER